MSSEFVIRERKPNRLKSYNYNKIGYYYITICTKNRLNIFGEILNNVMHLSQTGKIANEFWMAIPKHFKHIELDEYIVMPNHIHGIINVDHSVWNNATGNNDRCSLQYMGLPRNMQLIPKIISQFKSSVTREIRKKFDDFNFAWQKSYYDHIVRDDDDDLNRIQEYIINNPLNWDNDENNLLNEMNKESDKIFEKHFENNIKE